MTPQYKIAICRYCGKQFTKRINKSSTRIKGKVRPLNCKTCSKECTKLYLREMKSKIDYERYKKKLSTGNSRVASIKNKGIKS